MNLMRFADEQKEENYCVAWLEDGKSFVIRNPDEFTRKVLPNFFKATKFSSFTRKLYRWGFRQVNRGIGPDDPIIFGNEFFQRDNAELMAKMRSVTAASTRKAEATTVDNKFGAKRPLGAMDGGRDPKKALLDQLIADKTLPFGQSFYGGNSGAMNLTSALRPNLGSNPMGLGMGMGMGMNMGMGMGAQSFKLLGQSMSQTNPLLSSFQFQAHSANVANNNAAQGSQFPSAASTAEIVNAAINALRFAS